MATGRASVLAWTLGLLLVGAATTIPLKGEPAHAASAGATGTVSFESGVTRLAGVNRYETSLRISKEYAKGVSRVFVSLGTNFPDALSAASAAALWGGPLLLTPADALPQATSDEIARLDPAQIFVTGDARSISDSVVNELSRIAPTTRIGGVDRFDTGRQLVRSAFLDTTPERPVFGATHAIIANGRNFPDALSATGAAGSRQAPVILVDGPLDSVPSETLAVIDELGVRTLTIVGDGRSVSSGIESQLRAHGLDVTRLGGAGRYETAALINDTYFPSAVTTAFIAAGSNFPDALSAAALAGRMGAPLYISRQDCLPDPIRDSLTAHGSTSRVVLGDENSIGDAAARGEGCLTSGTPWVSGNGVVGGTVYANPGSWSPGTTFTYQWFAGAAAIAGADSPSLRLTSAFAGTQISVQVTGQRAGYVSIGARSGATLPIGYPDRTAPESATSCPAWAPIKGNASSMIYHVPGARFYNATHPEECFRTEDAARAAGYRKALV
jgi:putative cell wall-binding protein